MKLSVEPIGWVKSAVAKGRDDRWDDVTSELRIDERFAPGLQGLERFSHLLVVFWMHQSSFDAAADLVRCPRGRHDMPEVGIFAQRAKRRPNPIGITAVRLLERRGNILTPKGSMRSTALRSSTSSRISPPSIASRIRPRPNGCRA